MTPRRSPLLDEARELLGPPRSLSHAALKAAAPPRPPWLKPDDGLGALYAHFDKLLLDGTITWGCVVKANDALWQAGYSPAPAWLIHGADPDHDPPPTLLERVASVAFDLQNDRPFDPSWAEIARLARDDLDRSCKVPLPRSLASGLPLAASTTIVSPRHLPSPRLAAAILPVLIHPQLSPVAVLPADYWGEDLKRAWLEWNVT